MDGGVEAVNSITNYQRRSHAVEFKRLVSLCLRSTDVLPHPRCRGVARAMG